MRLYHFVNQEYGLANLAKRRLKIARWNDLNDPFELAGAIFADKDLRKEMRRIKDEIHAAMGMLCFSKNWKNPVQWSHYADNHRGICLGFDVQDHILQEVGYVTERVDCTLAEIEESSDKETHENIIHVMMTTKYVDWRYEQEVRVFSLQVRKRSVKTNIRSILTTKRALKKIYGSQSHILLRDATDTRYPYKDKETTDDKADRGRWKVFGMRDLQHDGMPLCVQRFLAFMDSENGTWDYAEGMNDARYYNDPWQSKADKAREAEEREARDAAFALWDALPPEQKAWLEVVRGTDARKNPKRKRGRRYSAAMV